MTPDARKSLAAVFLAADGLEQVSIEVRSDDFGIWDGGCAASQSPSENPLMKKSSTDVAHQRHLWIKQRGLLPILGFIGVQFNALHLCVVLAGNMGFIGRWHRTYKTYGTAHRTMGRIRPWVIAVAQGETESLN